jgi:hypothetical protein
LEGQKWIGPTWAHVDENLILRFTPTKTESWQATAGRYAGTFKIDFVEVFFGNDRRRPGAPA